MNITTPNLCDAAQLGVQYVLAAETGYINFSLPPGCRYGRLLQDAQRDPSIAEALWDLQKQVVQNRSTASGHLRIERVVTKTVVQESTQVVA